MALKKVYEKICVMQHLMKMLNFLVAEWRNKKENFK